MCKRLQHHYLPPESAIVKSSLGEMTNEVDAICRERVTNLGTNCARKEKQRAEERRSHNAKEATVNSEMKTEQDGSHAVDARIADLYERLLESWNRQDSGTYAGAFTEDGTLVGFDGSQVEGRSEIEKHLRGIFADHKTAKYVWKIREVRLLMSDVVLLRAVVGMVRPGQSSLNPAANAVQSLVATAHEDGWRVALFQNTPTQFHGRPEVAEVLTEELRALI